MVMTTKNILTVAALLLMVAGVALGILGYIVIGTFIVAAGTTTALVTLALLTIKVI